MGDEKLIKAVCDRAAEYNALGYRMLVAVEMAKVELIERLDV